MSAKGFPALDGGALAGSAPLVTGIEVSPAGGAVSVFLVAAGFATALLALLTGRGAALAEAALPSETGFGSLRKIATM